MSSSSHPEGLAIARQLIAREAEERTGFLDLGMLGLVEPPEELLKLTHLQRLNLGSHWWDAQAERWQQSSHKIACNTIGVPWAMLEQLSALTSLSCTHTQVSDLKPLEQLSALTSLDCSDTQVSDLKPLEQLSALTSLHCWGTQVSDLKPLEQLSALTSLDCSETHVSDLKPLEQLSALTSLNCSDTQVSDLKPLEQLSALTSLDCSDTQVSDLKPLEQLSALTSLSCSGTLVSDLPDWLIWRETLQRLYLHAVSLPGLPKEVLSPNSLTSCLERLRAHLTDLKSGDELLPDVKVVVIGNGRIGKTQICRRLRGEGFEPEADSTHGITVTCTGLDGPAPAHLHLWDFGGQDLYHGTHALFMKTRAVFVLVWTPESENAETHEHGGMTFRNQPLAYWLSYVRHLGGTDCPVLIVQNQCDTPADELLHPPLASNELEGFGFRKVLQFSAKLDRGRAALDEALRESISWLREKQGQARIGKGRLAVKRKLEEMRGADALLPVAERRQRTITQEHFHELCAAEQGISSPPLLLDYLHQCGIVFYRQGLFGDRIVLDQAWALEAVYAVFNRQKCFKQLQQLRGRFTRTLLEALVWQEFSVEEQKLFLSMMESCGICFIHRQGSHEKIETEYIAPDLLPGRHEVAEDIEERWPAEAPAEELVLEYPFLYSGMVRSVIAHVGRRAGLSAIYWNEGVCGYERTTRSHVLLEVQHAATTTDEAMPPYSGKIIVRATGAQPGELLSRIETWIHQEGDRTSAAGYKLNAVKAARQPVCSPMREIGVTGEEGEKLLPQLEFDTPPRAGTTYCVSYAWRDDSIKCVDELCKNAEDRGINILRDTNGLGLGERISKFMHKLAAGDRVFIILSEKYL